MNRYYISLLKETYDLNKGSISSYHPNLIVEGSISASKPAIEIIFDKLKSKRFEKPVSTNICQVKPILKSEYESCIKRNLELISSPDWDEGEYYVVPHADYIELVMYTINRKNQFQISIRIDNSYDYGSVEISRSSSFSNKRSYITHGKALEEKQFRRIFKLVYNYILDEGSNHINHHSLDAKIKLILSDEIKLSDSAAPQDVAYLEQLEIKKERLKARLINNDSDTPLDRATLRGELVGIEYAIQAYLHYQI